MEAQRQLDDTVLIVVRWGFEFLIASKQMITCFVSFIFDINDFIELFSLQLVRENRLPYRRLEQLASSLAS